MYQITTDFFFDGRGKQSRDLMMGFTPWEGWSWLPPELHRGVDNHTFTKVTRTLVRLVMSLKNVIG